MCSSDLSLSGIGTFEFNEIITGSSSGVTARVRSWSTVTNELDVYNVTGSFIVGENIVGSTSGASHQIRLIDIYQVDDGYTDNENIETEADQIVDFNERNPFGQP